MSGIAHITGSGFKKLLRLKGIQFHIDSFPDIPEVFNLIRYIGDIEWSEMFSTFNMGIGLVVIVKPDQKKQALDLLSSMDSAYVLGTVNKTENGRVEIKEYGVVYE
jgi:phosphoribosylformylglycinamidine cyclo-ligase